MRNSQFFTVCSSKFVSSTFLLSAHELSLSFPMNLHPKKAGPYIQCINMQSSVVQGSVMLLKPNHRLGPTLIKQISVKKCLSSLNEALDWWQHASQECFKSLASRSFPKNPLLGSLTEGNYLGKWAFCQNRPIDSYRLSILLLPIEVLVPVKKPNSKNPTPDYLPPPKKPTQYQKSKKQKGCNPAKAFYFLLLLTESLHGEHSILPFLILQPISNKGSISSKLSIESHWPWPQNHLSLSHYQLRFLCRFFTVHFQIPSGLAGFQMAGKTWCSFRMQSHLTESTQCT